MGGKGNGKEELTPPLVLLVLCVLSILCKANSLKTQRFVFTILIFGRNIRGDHLNMLVIWESRFECSLLMVMKMTIKSEAPIMLFQRGSRPKRTKTAVP